MTVATPDSRQQVLRSLREGEKQAKTVAEELGMETSVVYRHLEALRALGHVEAAETVEGPGRPKKRYRLTEAGRETFPREYAFLLDALVRQIIDQQGEKALEELVRPVAEELGAPYRDDKDPKGAIKRLIRLYNDLGFEASLEKDAGALLLTQRNCPFLRAAKMDPQAFCKGLDEEVMRQAAPGAKVTLEQTMARGDLRCRHRIELPGRKRFTRRRSPGSR